MYVQTSWGVVKVGGGPGYQALSQREGLKWFASKLRTYTCRCGITRTEKRRLGTQPKWCARCRPIVLREQYLAHLDKRINEACA